MDYLATNRATDHGLMAPTAENIKKEAGDKVIEAVADKGYEQKEDMAACLEKGIIPNVILPDGKGDNALEGTGLWKEKIVTFKLRPDREKMKQRMSISEHPFGTIKRALGAAYFLLKGKKKVGGEFALMATGYNLSRAENMFSFEELMELVGS